jgi:iron complex outermembrane receptor protein
MVRRFAFVLFCLLSGLMSNGASAQTLSLPVEELKENTKIELKKTEPAPEERGVERVEVTGSHIKRIDTEGPSPVQTITRKDLDKTGYNSVGDVLRDTTANTFGSQREASGSNAAGVAHVDLRGLGSSNTLVLLNGQRLPTDAVTGAVDLNLIPMAAVERVEVLKDGASAIYGSDALGGVVNIITRKDFNGSEISLAQSTPQMKGGRKDEISLVNGFNRGGLNSLSVVQYRNNEVVFSRDRSWTANSVSPTGSPGSYRDAGTGKWIADSNCPPELIQHTPNGDLCTFKTSNFSTELPALQQVSVMNETTYELNSRVKLKARAGATQRQVKWNYAPAPGTFTIPGNVADHLGPGGTNLPGHTPGKDIDVRYRLVELGNRDSRVDTNAFNVLLGSTVQLGGSWEMEITGSHNRVENSDRGVNGYALTQTLKDAISSGRFNPFGTPGARGALDDSRYVPSEKTMSLLSSADLKTTGELYQLPAGPLSLALGTTMMYQSYKDAFDDASVNDLVFGNAGSSGGGMRSSNAVYTELNIPITKKLELQAAERFDHYSDFGDTVNPKGALLYHASKSVLLRASAGTGFKAPLMQDLYAANSNGFPTFIDRVACNAERQAGGATPSCLPQQYQVTSSGNTGLKEERSMTYNAGAVYEPNKDFNIGADWFLTKTRNVVGIDYNDAMNAEAAGTDLSKYGVIVHRTNGYIDSIEAPLQNLSAQQVSGIDLSTSIRMGKTKLSIDHAQLFYFKEEGFPGTGMLNKMGRRGRPAWKDTVAYSIIPNERNDLTFVAMTTAGQDKTVSELGRLRRYTQLDVEYSYKSRKLGTFMAGIKNVMGTTPPLDDTDPTAPLDVTLYDQIGRQYYTGYKVMF